jgi:glutathione S-transferase
MEWIALVSLLAVLEYQVFAFQVGLGRQKYEIEAPATTGNEIFERMYRVQVNTIEQLVVFLPSLWVFGAYVSAPVGAGLGVVFLVGRALYAVEYVKEPASRTAGFLTGYLANAVLLLGGLGGAVMKLV